MEKIDAIFMTILIIIGLPLLFITPTTNDSELLICIVLIKLGIAFLIQWAIYKLYQYQKL